jgi:predicted nucleic acid-binding Zn ribbon protein
MSLRKKNKMAFRLFDFKCSNGHEVERLVPHDQEEIPCDQCSEISKRMISAPNFKLDGCSGDYPTAYDAWERKRIEKRQQEVKQSS